MKRSNATPGSVWVVFKVIVGRETIRRSRCTHCELPVIGLLPTEHLTAPPRVIICDILASRNKRSTCLFAKKKPSTQNLATWSLGQASHQALGFLCFCSPPNSAENSQHLEPRNQSVRHPQRSKPISGSGGDVGSPAPDGIRPQPRFLPRNGWRN